TSPQLVTQVSLPCCVYPLLVLVHSLRPAYLAAALPSCCCFCVGSCFRASPAAHPANEKGVRAPSSELAWRHSGPLFSAGTATRAWLPVGAPSHSCALPGRPRRHLSHEPRRASSAGAAFCAHRRCTCLVSPRQPPLDCAAGG
ncbi:hypothetical protein V5799_017997, partial [Amblyomma americanum]